MSVSVSTLPPAVAGAAEYIGRDDAAFAAAFEAAVAAAVQRGADLSLVWPRFVVAILEDQEFGVAESSWVLPYEDERQLITDVISLYQRVIAGGSVAPTEWAAAGNAAGQIGNDAWDAAADAAYVACGEYDDPQTAALAAHVIGHAYDHYTTRSDAAAWSGTPTEEEAMEYAASERANAHRWQAETLIRLINEA